MKKQYIIVAFLSQLLLVSCGNSDSKIIKLVEERDSLRSLNATQAGELENYGQVMDLINSTLDSIAIQENMLFTNKSDMPVTKGDVRSNIYRFKSVLKTQKDRIDKLEKQLSMKNDSNSNTVSLIAHLREQIEIKDMQIAQLQSDLEKKNVDISKLQEQVKSQRLTIDTQKNTITELDQRAKKQGEALVRQDEILNNGYFLIGSKDDLKRKGIINNKGTLVSDAILDKKKFAKVDIRTWKEVSFSAKRPRILTNIPVSSYELTTTGNRNYTLTVKNAADFWRISNYLVIQTD